MASVNLLDINVDTLFRQYGIHEIDQVHKKLQQNIEEKKEELRIMVGERYRDLLQAADTIGQMRSTSSNVIEHIEAITNSCRRIYEHQLIGFKIETNADLCDDPLSQYDQNQKIYYGCMAQIHLLTKLPEMIWNRLDDADYFVATQLFIFARHISTGLQLDANMDIMRKFPVAKRHWNHLKQFFFMIKQMCLEQLEKPELTTETAIKCLTSLVLLENCQLDKLLTMFIQLRVRAFRKTLISDNDNDDTEDELAHRSAKKRILNGLQLLNKTLLHLFKCFIDVANDDNDDDDEKCLLIKELEVVTGINAKPIIALVQLDDSLINDALPSVISKFKPQISIQPIDSNAIQRALDTWLKSTENDTKQLLQVVIDNISSVRTIHNINKAVLELEKPTNWKDILQSLHLDPNIDFYQKFYEPLLQDRIKAIITGSWATAMESTEKHINELFQGSLTNEKSFWVETIEDNPRSLKQALDPNRQSHHLLMKSKGYTNDICQICNQLDQSIESIYNDLSLYVKSTNVEMLHLEDDPIVRKVNANLVDFLRNCSQNGVTDLISRVKSLSAKNSDRSEFIMFLAKLLKAITEICPFVKQCFMPTTLLVSNAWSAESNISKIEHWERAGRSLNDESIMLWKQWIELFLIDCLSKNNGLCFSIQMDLVTLLDIFPNWQTYTIEEKDESNASVQSTIRVPAHPSIPLQNFLFDCCSQLNERVPETLSKPVTALLSERLLDCIINTYSELSDKNELILTNQNASLQMYFDLKYLSILFSIRKRNDQLQTMAIKFKNAIDPFDFELFHKYMNGNVKFAAQRTIQQYSLLIPSSLADQLATITKQSSASLTQEKDPNLLSLANSNSHNNWFNLLPIVVTKKNQPALAEATETKSATSATKNEKRKSPAKVGGSSAPLTSQQNLANVKSNAAAFFGAMSQDWFR